MKRILAWSAIALFVVLSCNLIPFAPVRPFIQLPGEVYPGTQNWPIIGDIFGGLTNTFMSAVLAFVIVLVMALSLRARSRTADEVPTGFYNFFEMVMEGAYNFAANIAGEKKVKDFFPFFMTFILYILVANWLGLVPSYDSIGIWEDKTHFLGEKVLKDLETQLVAGDISTADIAEEYHMEEVVFEDGHFEHETEEELLHHIEVDLLADKIESGENLADNRSGFFLLRSGEEDLLATGEVTREEAVEIAEAALETKETRKAAAIWTIVPFFRPAATDLNFTLAFAVVAMVAVQFYGFKYLGARDYLAKFFPFIGKNFGAEVSDNPIRAIDVAVGALELVSEISKIISFAFRLLGNIFAGMVLLFVMSFLLPAANIVFYGLEFFVGLIQALVFALLMLIFMTSATESHHGDDHDH